MKILIIILFVIILALFVICWYLFDKLMGKTKLLKRIMDDDSVERSIKIVEMATHVKEGTLRNYIEQGIINGDLYTQLESDNEW